MNNIHDPCQTINAKISRKLTSKFHEQYSRLMLQNNVEVNLKLHDQQSRNTGYFQMLLNSEHSEERDLTGFLRMADVYGPLVCIQQPFSRTFLAFLFKICKFECNTTSDWLNRMV